MRQSSEELLRQRCRVLQRRRGVLRRGEVLHDVAGREARLRDEPSVLQIEEL
jgi:hypothetical protein